MAGDDGAPLTYTSFRKLFDKAGGARAPLVAPQSLPAPPDALAAADGTFAAISALFEADDDDDDERVELIKGGCAVRRAGIAAHALRRSLTTRVAQRGRGAAHARPSNVYGAFRRTAVEITTHIRTRNAPQQKRRG